VLFRLNNYLIFVLTKTLSVYHENVLLLLIGLAVLSLLVIRNRDRKLEASSLRSIDRTAKMVAASGFVCLALLRDPGASAYGSFILLGLALSWLGDLFLTYTKSASFKAGILAFLAAHVAYIFALLQKDIAGDFLSLSVLACVCLLFFSWLWLRNHLDGDFKLYVPIYLLAISTMVALALAASLSNGTWLLFLAAGSFAISDLFVARERFIMSSFSNALIGLPLYFFGQVLFALSI